MVNTDSKKSLILKNDYICREFRVERKRLYTVCIQNLLTGRSVIPQDNSEEFSVIFGGFPKRVLECSELKVEQIKAYELDGISTACFLFREVKVRGNRIRVVLYNELADDARFISRRLELHCEDGDGQIRLDNICFDSLSLDPLLKKTQPPEQDDCDISGFQMALGQPVFVDTLFFGCAFPASVNRIRDDRMTLSYYSGKALSELLEGGVYMTVSAVCGVCPGEDERSLREGFYDYADFIALPSRFRCQYNSWYDHMLDISDDKLLHSFYEIEKGCTQYGLPPLDAYTVDDGWNDYTAPFWSFNSKFPDGMFPASATARLLGSSFGLWLGPRGGYNKQSLSFAKRVQDSGNGHFNPRARDLCVASSVYLKNLQELLGDYLQKYDITYLKLDGFCKKPCKETAHGHMTGGKDHLYYYTDLCEKWMQLFSSLRSAREKQGKELHINATCYLNPSPWWLPYVNTVWIQNSADCGALDTAEDGTKLAGSDKDRLMSYRDERYHDFYRTRRLMLPPRYIYNHEPVYGSTAKVQMTSEEFLQYLLMNACRGTAFWELYYSYELMDDEKWAYSAAVLNWARKYSDILSRSHMMGSSPRMAGVYGYACFKGNDGVIALRNPTQKEVSYTLCFDKSSGLTQDMTQLLCQDAVTGSLYGSISYGGNMEIKLLPHEMKVFAFGEVEPLTIPVKAPQPVKKAQGEALSGQQPFTVRLFITPDCEGTLFSCSDQLTVRTDADKKITFTLGEQHITSRTKVTDCAQATVVKEPNGMLKLYIDGILEASACCTASPTDINGVPVISSQCKATVYSGAVPFDEVLSL